MDWRPVSGFENLYEVSEDGNVLSLRTGNIMKPHVGTSGYYEIRLTRKTCDRIHRIVGKAFLPNPENKTYIDHINGNKLDNRVENLRWVSGSENNMNMSKQSRNTSGYRGICFDTSRNQWHVSLVANKKRVSQKRFKTLDEAVAYRKSLEDLHFGEFSRK